MKVLVACTVWPWPCTVAVFVRRGQFSDCIPATHIAPGGGKGQHGNVGGFFHDGIVDAVRAAGGKAICAQAAKVAINRLGGYGLLARGQYVGGMGALGFSTKH
ncbi:hypothetical protein [Candidatus Aalborgicola defluviihabitans]|uniref:hypothetical protein n=1 Tax=Candidatus Aalborgicola defluviihabitans TaxID=3386187 RepID=UPI0039B91007